MPARLEPHDDRRTVNIDKPILFVGRHPECDLVINDSRKVSRKHCCLAEINGNFLVRDLGSTNGIQINGRRVTGTRELNSGDELTIGDVAYTFLDSKARKQKPVPQEQETPSLSDDGIPYKSEYDSKADVHELVDHELSSEVPIMLDEPDGDGFELFDGPRSSLSSNRGLAGSDSRPELIAD
ncbi:FHA domain-containing protein [Rubinisphaera italica]|uniref:Oxoglutarate dehydrogenase inhibitor n=1 Tax=Rubinisphaera italica TaxID=2527969 RepID=A0A5C5XB19_9PLAN|nr:FHA domain-containing protein [Rubinisphaera italica]TWT60226.1 Oxoglutarate dehydrogenase inhibitor [Rubinisphaera italica]